MSEDDKTGSIPDPRERLEQARVESGPVETPDEVRHHPTPQERDEAAEAERSRVSVVRENPGTGEGQDDEYQWHTGVQRPTGVQDAIEFVDVHKAFGRNKILRGLNMGIPEHKISMILGPSGTGKSVCIKHMVGLLYPDQGDMIVQGESVPNMLDDELFEMRKRSACCSRTARCSAR